MLSATDCWCLGALASTKIKTPKSRASLEGLWVGISNVKLACEAQLNPVGLNKDRQTE
jgi:hypothetical protein